MKARFRVLMLSATLCLLPMTLIAQNESPPQPGSANINIITFLQKHWLVEGKVVTLQGDPVKDAKLVVEPAVSAENRTLKTNLPGEFQTEYSLNADLVKEFSVRITVTKKGFLAAHEFIDYGNSDKPRILVITLRPEIQDPNLLWQEDLISSLGPRLKNLGTSDGLSAKSEKDYARGVQEFLDRNRPDRALPFFAKVVKRDTSCVKCRTMLALAELASGDWDSANRDVGEAVNETLKDRTVGRAEPLLVFGVLESWQHEPDKATAYFAEALKFAPQDRLALQEIGRAQLRLENWQLANAYLSKAISAGATSDVRLMRVEALVGEGNSDEANKEMTLYLNGRDVKNMPLRVRQLWAQVLIKKKVEAAYAKPSSPAHRPIDYLHDNLPELKGLEPVTDQGQLDSILSAVGKNVAAYFQNFPNTVSLEEIHQEKLRHNGKVGGSLDQKFHYLCLTPAEASGPGFSEYRADLSGERGQPHGLQDGFMLTSGFASASLVFHPVYQPETTFRYLGLQKINSRDTFVIAFAQQPTKARLNGNFKLGENTMPTFSQGLAWVDSESYQIIRLRTDLLKPLPEVRLDKETTEIDFVGQHFKDIAEVFWLPREVTVSVDWNGKSLRNTHEYSDFKLFNVESSQKIGNPKEPHQTSNEKTDP